MRGPGLRGAHARLSGGAPPGERPRSVTRISVALQDVRRLPVIDEYPYGDEVLEGSRLMVVLCGSHVGMMEREAVSSRAPLFGRRTGQIRLRPLPPGVAAMLLEQPPLRIRVHVHIGSVEDNDGTRWGHVSTRTVENYIARRGGRPSVACPVQRVVAGHRSRETPAEFVCGTCSSPGFLPMKVGHIRRRSCSYRRREAAITSERGGGRRGAQTPPRRPFRVARPRARLRCARPLARATLRLSCRRMHGTREGRLGNDH